MLRIVGLSILLVSCTQGLNLKNVNLGPLFNDGNSKVWMVDKEIKGKVNIAPFNYDQKRAIVFYSSGMFRYTSMKDLGNRSTADEKGDYLIDSEKRILTMYFKGDVTWEYSLIHVTEDSIYMEPTKKSTSDLTLKLSPYPEF